MTTAATTDVDANARQHRKSVIADRAARCGDAKATTKPASPEPSGNRSPAGETTDRAARDKARRRFVTLNTFVDAVGRYLQSSDREVWHVLFRFADGATNVAEVRLADIACRLGRHSRTVARSIDRLSDAGLVERIKRGTRQGGPSRYLIDPEPGRHAAALRKSMDARCDGQESRRRGDGRPPKRSSSGQFKR